MYPEDQGILSRVKKPGPLTRALVTSGIAQMPILPEQSMAFADGGITRQETADELMARMSAKYGAPAAGPAQQPATVAQQQAAPKPAPTQPASSGQGILGILRGRKEAIDKATNFADGGIAAGAPKRFKFEGEGGPREDKVPVKVAGQTINVSDGEQALIVPAKTAANAQAMKAIQDIIAGSNDGRQPDMGNNAGPNFSDGGMTDEEARKLTYQDVTGIATPQPTAQPAAQNAPTDPDTDGRRLYSANMGDAFANRGSSFAPDGPSNGPDSNVLTPKVPGITTQTPTDSVPAVRLGITSSQDRMAVTRPAVRQASGEQTPSSNLGVSGIAALRKGRNEQGVITAESAQSVTENPMTRSGGVSGSVDMAGVNGIMARENQARGEMIDASIRANGGNGIGILGGGAPTEAETINAERTNRWAVDGMIDAVKRAGNRSERAALGQALSQTIAGQNQQATEAIRQQGGIEQRGILAGIEASRQVGAEHRAADRNQIQMRGQDVRAATAAERIDSQERISEKRTQDAGTRLTLPQRRSNFEITAARKAVAGLTPEEIKHKTANYTATGRENPNYDPTLAKAVSLAGRRMYGDDAEFDQRQQEQAQQPAGTDGDVMTRFRADAGMKGHTIGKQTDMGVEVLDASGKLIGHYR
jgi:hypothetical protein